MLFNLDGGGIVVSMSSGSQLYQSNPQIMHQMNRNQQRPMQPGQPQIQMMQQQGTPPNQLNYNTSSPYTPPQNPSTPQQQQQYSSQVPFYLLTLSVCLLYYMFDCLASNGSTTLQSAAINSTRSSNASEDSTAECPKAFNSTAGNI